MTDAALADHGAHDAAARLHQLLAELQDAATLPRSDPRSQQQLELCGEVESILRSRAESRRARRVG